MERLSNLLKYFAGRQLPESQPIYQPNGALVHVVRRPGCPFCLTLAKQLSEFYQAEQLS